MFFNIKLCREIVSSIIFLFKPKSLFHTAYNIETTWKFMNSVCRQKIINLKKYFKTSVSAK
jgi:hypothetical protein